MNFWDLLTDISILLTASLILGAILMKLNLNPLIGYIIAGVFLGGPGSLNLIHSPAEIETISELGISLLLFSLGLEFSWDKLKNFSNSTTLGGVLQVLITPIVIIILGYFLGFDIKPVVFFALVITLSSTATVLRSLVDLFETDSPHGRNATATLLLQDIAVVPFTVIVSALIATGAESQSSNLVLSLIIIISLVVGAYLLINKIAVPILGLFTLEKNREMSVLLATIIGVGSAWAAHQAGISPAIGAFIAGMMLGSSPFATQITSDVSPLRILFLTLFFGSVGMVADPIWIFNNFGLVIGLTLAVIATKTIISFLIFKLTKNTIAISLATALAISQVGEFAFVLGTIARKGGLISEDLNQIIFSVTIMSILITAILIKSAPKIGLAVQNLFKEKSTLEVMVSENACTDENEIFILGFGPTGQQIANVLKENNLHDVTVIDLSQSCINQAKAFGYKAYIGDVRQTEVLQHYKLHNAKHIFVSIPSQEAALKAIYISKQLAPCALIYARSRYQKHEALFIKAGAQHVVNEELMTGSSLGNLALTCINQTD